MIPSCDYQIRRQSNDQKRKRVCEKTTKVEYLEKEKKGTWERVLNEIAVGGSEEERERG